MVDTLASGASGGNPVEVQVLSSAPIQERLPKGAFFVSRPDCRPAPGRAARLFLTSLIFALSLSAATPVAAQEQDDQAVHPEVQKADAQREKAKRRERMLLLFPAGALGITIALIVITRRRKK